MRPRVGIALCRAALAAALAGIAAPATAHDGPPFPILSDHTAGPYRIGIWTDPDATDDGTTGGQFWIMLEGPTSGSVPAGTRVVVSVAPLDRAGPTLSAAAAPVSGEDPARQFAAVQLDHEGPFRVRVDVSGPLGPVSAEAQVEATYDLRPAPIMLVVYALPFVALGALWFKVMMRRRASSAGRRRLPPQ